PFSNKKVVVAPLNWGIGHATRLIPVITKLLDNDNIVYLAGDGNSFDLLKKRFPYLHSIDLPHLNIRYSSSNSLIFKGIIQLPHFFHWLIKEKNAVREIQNVHNFDVIISDNRWFFRHTRGRSIYISHQLFIKLPKQIGFLERYIFKLQKKIIERFDEVWVPDFENTAMSLAGELSHPPQKFKIPIKYIGILSHLKKQDISLVEYDICVLISGPPPQNIIFEKTICNNLPKNLKIIVIGSSMKFVSEFSTITFLPVQESEKVSEYISKSRLLVARAGYSTIMDCVSMEKSAILVPTPGQIEQEYLAEIIKHKLLRFVHQRAVTACFRDFL
ncbi:MAG: glycosyltransferase, partial [Bacteroidales bacterium]